LWYFNKEQLLMNTYIEVPYKEKDDAKALGARWDGVLKKWYIPEGTELALFHRWLPSELQATQAQTQVASGEQVAAYSVATIQGIPLSQLLSNVQRVVASAFQQSVWTLVEVMQVQIKNGHVYLELSERNTLGDALATARAIIWVNNANRILPALRI